MLLPKVRDLYNPLLAAINALGGSASIEELDQETIRILGLTEEEASIRHSDRYTEIGYRLAWTRTHLKLFGALDSNGKGVWFLTPAGKLLRSVDPQAVDRARGRRKAKAERFEFTENQVAHEDSDSESSGPQHIENEASDIDANWAIQLLDQVMVLSPNAFERLCQRLLREAGFMQVRVTGRSGDGGIDGVGIVQLGGLLSFPAYFQCKRYKGTVGAGVIRDFRGAMAGRGNHGLIITTGSFTADALREATRDGVPPIDLVDGDRLASKLKELGLGVRVEIVEKVTVVPEFFEQF